MTAAEKTTLARFLDTCAAGLTAGYRSAGEPPLFTDDEIQITEALPSPGAQEAVSPEGAAGQEDLSSLGDRIRACSSCALANTRRNAVPGEGVPGPLVLVIGEGPGAEEDASGRPFVGPAGQLLDKMLAAVGLSRQHNCYIANTVKCRPPNNRDPAAEEIAACAPYLALQIAQLRPLVIFCAGKVAANRLLHGPAGEVEPIGRLRGRFHDYSPEAPGDGPPPPRIPLLASYHPSALLRDESLKKPAFEDLKLLMIRLAGLDAAYRSEAGPLMSKYAAADAAFAAAVEEYLR